MAKALFRILRKASPKPSIFQPISCHPEFIFSLPKHPSPPTPSWFSRNVSHGSVNLVLSLGKLKFETHETDPPKKEKWQTKKRLKQRRMREKEKRKSANKRDPRRLTVKGKKKKQKFANAEERIKSKLEKARIKEALLIERLKRYEVPKVQGPIVEPVNLTGEERFYMKKMAQKRSNYVPVGRRGVFGGVILNMHMHWKKHETVKVICKPCKPGQVHEYANEIARLSGGMPIQILGDDTIIFYRGKNYVQPKVMSPIDTLSKKKALEKSKYEQSLESVRRFISIAEKELELYYRHVAIYGDPNDRNPMSIFDGPSKYLNKSGKEMPRKENFDMSTNEFSGPIKYMNEPGKEMPRRENFDMSTNGFSFSPQRLSDTESDSTDEELGLSLSASEDDLEDGNCSVTEFDSYDEDEEENDFDSDSEESAGKFSVTRESSGTILG